MTASGLPIGRRVAQWRVRRGMTQQVFADRLGKSASWVDKVERGVRGLDRLSVIHDIAAVLRIDPTVLTGRTDAPARQVNDTDRGVDEVRAALAHYDTALGGPVDQPAPPLAELARNVTHAWLTFRHARYPQLLRALPALIVDAQRAHATHRDAAALTVQVYRVTASLLVKLGAADLAWLAADRAIAAADPGGVDPGAVDRTGGGRRLLAATAAIQLGEALRALGRARLALAATATAADRVTAAPSRQPTPDELAACGALLLQAALAAASYGDGPGVQELIGQAHALAVRVGESPDDRWTGFAPVAVRLARVTAAVELGDGYEAVRRHQEATAHDGWFRLSTGQRGAYLLDVARAYLLVGDLDGAGRTLVEADRTAPAEVRTRPAGRTVLGELLRGGPVPAGVAHLAAAVGVTRR